MKKLFTFILLLTLGATLQGQTKEISRDDPKALDLSFLIKHAGSDLDILDGELLENAYSLAETKTEADIVSYKYIGSDKGNTFIFKRYILRKSIVYIMDYYTDGLIKKYANQIVKEGLTLKQTKVIENGIKRFYIDSRGAWSITFSKIISGNKSSLEISISPI